jgi:hypothetical protein
MLEQIWGIAGFVTPTTIDGTIENVNLITAQAAFRFNCGLRSTSKYTTQHQF